MRALALLVAPLLATFARAEEPVSLSLHVGVGAAQLRQDGADQLAYGTSSGPSVQLGLAVDYALNRDVALGLLLNSSLNVMNYELTMGALIGPELKLSTLMPVQFTLAGGVWLGGGTPDELTGFGLLGRVSYLVPGHSFGPYVQLQYDRLQGEVGFDQLTASVGLQVQTF